MTLLKLSLVLMLPLLWSTHSLASESDDLKKQIAVLTAVNADQNDKIGKLEKMISDLEKSMATLKKGVDLNKTNITKSTSAINARVDSKFLRKDQSIRFYSRGNQDLCITRYGGESLKADTCSSSVSHNQMWLPRQ